MSIKEKAEQYAREKHGRCATVTLDDKVMTVKEAIDYINNL